MRVFRFSYLFLLALAVSSAACKQRIRVLKSPPHYKFAFAAPGKLDNRLQKIAGIAWDSKNNVFWAVCENNDTLFMLERTSRSVQEVYPLGDNGNYRDLALYNGAVYVLRGNGMLIKFTKDSTGQTSTSKQPEINTGGTNVFETLYTDTARKALVMVCKNCSGDNEKTISAYAFYPDSTGFDNKPLYILNADEISRLSPFKTDKFQPSAAAVNPVMKKLFLISAATRQLVIAGTDGKVDSVYKLSAKLFPRPTGISFHKSGEMYIVSQGVSGKPTFLGFRYVDEGGTADNKKNIAYNFASPDERMELGEHLHEISGMSWIPGQDVMLAENDEKGDIFTVDFKNHNDKAGKEKFGGKGDYEDIVYKDSVIYMLISSGTIVKVKNTGGELTTEQFDLPAGGNNEFETMYYDEDRNALILLCKECSGEKKTEIRTAYQFNLSTSSFAAEPAYTIQVSEVREMINDKEALFKPSAAAINPVDHKLYIVASVGKLLVIADKTTGKPEQVIRLNETLYNQPEGMTIAPNGDIYISNEGGTGVATILRFVRKK